MGIISSMRRQDAVVWSFDSFDDMGQPCLNSPVQIRCRWDGGTEEYVREDGTKSVSSATVYPDRLVPVGSVMWLGLMQDLEYVAPGEAKKNDDAAEVGKSVFNPNLKATETLFTCSLEPTAWRGRS